MKTLLLGFLIGICASSLAWLAASDISARFQAVSDRMDRHEQAISILVQLKASGQ